MYILYQDLNVVVENCKHKCVYKKIWLYMAIYPPNNELLFVKTIGNCDSYKRLGSRKEKYTNKIYFFDTFF